jgi:D-3-phosphoglycerate dehydrogenase
MSAGRHGPWRILATSPGRNWDIEEEAIRAANGEAEFITIACQTEQALVAAARDVDGIYAGNEPYTRRILEQLGRVKVISRPAVGFDQVDIEAAAELGIVVTHVPDYCTDEVSDHALALLLGLHRRIPWLAWAIRDGRWAQAPVYGGDRPASFHAGEVPGPRRQLRDQTLGIVGFGRIGRRVAEKARGFGLRLLAHDPYLPADAGAPYGVTMTDLDSLLAEADLVTIHCLLNAGTHGLIGAAQFARMKPTAVLVNTARGPIVDPDALVAALQGGQIAAAALDVTDPEPPAADSPLLSLPNLILTPHSAYYSDRSRAEVRRRGIEHALAVLRGERPYFVANPAVFATLAARERAAD